MSILPKIETSISNREEKLSKQKANTQKGNKNANAINTLS